MTAEIISLSGMDADDRNYQAFLKELDNDSTTNAIFWLEKADGTLRVGCNYTDRRDLVYALHKVNNLIQSILNHEAD